jgi:acetyl-CoA C-acetyltransferase
MIDLTGFAHTPFARQPEADIETLMAEVAATAIADAGLEPSDIDAVVVGHFGVGMVKQGFVAGLSAGLLPGLRMTPAVRVENACASGSAAVHQAALAIRAGSARRVLVIGAEVMSQLSTREVGNALLRAAYYREEAETPAGFAGMFGVIADRYAERFGDPRDAMARIASKNHANAAHNPLAQYRNPLTTEFCATESEKNPRVVGRLLRTDCSPISDGAAALVMCASDAHDGSRPFVRLRATAQANDLMPISQRDMSELTGARVAWQRLLESARLTLDDLDSVEVHDCFTIAELMMYEAIGLTPPGGGHRALEEGWVHAGGKLPVNLSGGLKTKGHPIGATGVSMHVISAWMLLGRFRADVLPDARFAGILNMGGASVANYGSILERVQ